MNCHKIKELINDYIDQTIPAENSKKIEEHLKSCHSCKEEYLSLKEVVTALNDLPQVSPPQDFTQNIMSRIFKDQIRIHPYWLSYLKRGIFAPRSSFRLTGRVALTTAVIILFALIFLFNQPDISPECLKEVRFSLRLSEGKFQTVAIAGDFNQWNFKSNPLENPDGDGTWTTTLKLPPGRYEYMFVLDGKEWIPDPNSNRFVRDGFGNRNAVLEINNCNST